MKTKKFYAVVCYWVSNSGKVKTTYQSSYENDDVPQLYSTSRLANSRAATLEHYGHKCRVVPVIIPIPKAPKRSDFA